MPLPILFCQTKSRNSYQNEIISSVITWMAITSCSSLCHTTGEEEKKPQETGEDWVQKKQLAISQRSILSFIACLLYLESTKTNQDKDNGNISEGFEIWNVGCVLETLQEVDDEDLEDQMMAFGWMGVSRWQKTVSSFGLMEKCQRLFTSLFNIPSYILILRILPATLQAYTERCVAVLPK